MILMKPSLKVIAESEMQARMDSRSKPPWYVRLGIYPGGDIDRDPLAVVITEEVYKKARTGVEWALRLVAHEYGHAVGWPEENHSGNVWQRIGHAVRVGLDVRASNRLLRWRRGGSARWTEFYSWWEGHT